MNVLQDKTKKQSKSTSLGVESNAFLNKESIIRQQTTTHSTGWGMKSYIEQTRTSIFYIYIEISYQNLTRQWSFFLYMIIWLQIILFKNHLLTQVWLILIVSPSLVPVSPTAKLMLLKSG